MLFEGAELELLYKAARTLLREGEYGELLSAWLGTAMEGLGADRGFVVVREDTPAGPRYRAAVARNFRSDKLAEAEEEISSSISRAVMEQGKALLVDDALGSEFANNPSVKRLALRSMLVAPLVASDEAFALLYLENRDVSRRFHERRRHEPAAAEEEIEALLEGLHGHHQRALGGSAPDEDRRLPERIDRRGGASD